MRTIRVPSRVLFYISGTGWYQESTCEGDAVRQRLRARLDGAPRNADRSATLVVEPELLERLERDARHLYDATLYGDNTPDELADRNSARAFLERVRVARDT